MTDQQANPTIEPITESDMNFLRSLLERVANTIVSHSQLMQEVETLRRNQSNQAEVLELRDQLRQLRDEYDTIRSERDELRATSVLLAEERNSIHNRNLDLRGQLDDMTKKYEEAVTSYERMVTEHNHAAKTVFNLDTEITDLKAELSRAKSDRDNEGFRVLELTEQRDKLAARLDTIKAALNG